MTKSLLAVVLASTVSIGSAIPLAGQGPGSTNGWGGCSWTYTAQSGIVVNGDGSYIITNQPYYYLARNKTEYREDGVVSVPCPQAGCIRPDPVNYSFSREKKLTTTKTWSGKVSGTLNWLWNLLIGMPFEATRGGTETSEIKNTTVISGTVTAGNKVLLFETLVQYHKVEHREGGGKTEHRSQNDESTDWRLQELGTLQSFAPCTAQITGPLCPAIPPEVCEPEGPG